MIFSVTYRTKAEIPRSNTVVVASKRHQCLSVDMYHEYLVGIINNLILIHPSTPLIPHADYGNRATCKDSELESPEHLLFCSEHSIVFQSETTFNYLVFGAATSIFDSHTLIERNDLRSPDHHTALQDCPFQRAAFQS